MNKYFLSFIVLFFGFNAKSQLNLLVYGGLHSVDVKASDFIITNQSTLDSFQFALEKASYGYHFGIGLQLKFNHFYIQPELQFNSNKANFKVKDFSVPNTLDSIKSEKYQYIDLPVIIGFKAGLIRLYAGPVAHFFIHNSSELFDVGGYDDKFETATFGYQAGLGFDIGFIGIDIKHEGNFSKYGEHVTFFGKKLKFDKNASRLLGTISFKF
ncbi:MAG: outer membrane beta-barrel protein [Saprospiraceae bacterium]|nr:outer membrane beta-barrel protein [Saprospiraceae bacterium]